MHCAQKLQEGSSESVLSEDQVESVQLTPNLQIDHAPAYARIDKQDGIGQPNFEQHLSMTHKPEGEEEEDMATPSRTLDRRAQPHSRPKQRCYRKLRHPSRGFARGRSNRRRTHTSSAQEVEDLRNREDLQATQEWKSNLNIKELDTAETGVTKPTSRSKRRCRFGPRARRALDKSHGTGAQRSTFVKSQAPRLYPDAEQQPTLLPQDSLSSLPKAFPQDPDSLDTWILPDRVTLQHAKGTPFGHYRAESGLPDQEANIFNIAADRLGSTATEFEDPLTKEIDEFLSEIESARLNVQRHTSEEAASVLRSPDSSEAGGSGDNTNKKDRLDEGKNAHQVLPSLERSRCQSENASYTSPRTERGRGKTRTSTPSRRDPPPLPPLGRTSFTGDDEQRLTRSDAAKWLGQGTADSMRPSFSLFSSQVQDPSDEEAWLTTLPDRSTLFHGEPAKNSSVGRFLKQPGESHLSPLRSIHTRLGLSEVEFDTLLSEEIDEVFLTSETLHRRCNKDWDCEAPS